MSKLIVPAVAISLVLSLFSCQKEEVTKRTNKMTTTTEMTNNDLRAILKDLGVKMKSDAYAKLDDSPIKKVYVGKWTQSTPQLNQRIKCMPSDRICYFIVDLTSIAEPVGEYTKTYDDDDFMVCVGDEFNYAFYGKVIDVETGIGYTDYILRK
ncbi:MAG: hypothetical protein N4A41_07585 [Crocinitomicaceae bacterium]|jgi:hypothetical protein|nr:hypothetical protein [Crocinitomicaceae bacterium]